MSSSIDQRQYELKTGRYATPQNVEDLSSDEIIELGQKPVTALEVLFIRKNMHDLTDRIGNVLGSTQTMFEDIQSSTQTKFEEIQKSLSVTVKNGKERKVSIGELTLETYELLSGTRKRKRLWNAIKENKILLLVTGGILVGFFALYFKIDWLLSGLVPILIALGKELFFKS